MQDPYNNIVRTTIEALAAVCWAAPSRCTRTRSTRRLALPTDLSARIARNTQLILREEAGLTRVVDPLAGSYYLESPDRQHDRRRPGSSSKRSKAGGWHDQPVEAGLPKRRIEEAAARRQARIDRGEDVIVGVNRYQVDE